MRLSAYALGQGLVAFGLFVFASPLADAATITGTVTGPDGAPFRAAFVQARHTKLKMTISVLSDNQGRYVVENLPAGEYRLQVRVVGLNGEPKSGIDLGADQSISHDFALRQGVVKWSDISILQGLQLLHIAVENCFSSHLTLFRDFHTDSRVF